MNKKFASQLILGNSISIDLGLNTKIKCKIICLIDIFSSDYLQNLKKLL